MDDLMTELPTQLKSLLQTPAPPCAMNIAAARERGRALKRRRLAGTAGSATLAIALVAALVGIAALPGSQHGENSLSAPSGSPRVSSPGTSTGIDPLVRTLAFGWLPASVRTTGFIRTLGPGSSITKLAAAGAGTSLSVTTLPAGQLVPDPPQAFGTAPARTSAPEVNGRTAYWLSAPGSSRAAVQGRVIFVWQYAANSWAFLNGDFGGTSPADVTAAVYRIAANLKLNQHEPVPAAFHLSEVPAGLTLTSVSWTGAGTPGTSGSAADGTAWQLKYGQASVLGAGGTVEQQSFEVLVEVSDSSSAQSDQNGGTPVTVDGHQASLLTEGDGVDLTVPAADGLLVDINAQGTKALAMVNAAGGITTFFRHEITLLGPSPANWTTNVVG